METVKARGDSPRHPEAFGSIRQNRQGIWRTVEQDTGMISALVLAYPVTMHPTLIEANWHVTDYMRPVH
jgi:hypothetical protein